MKLVQEDICRIIALLWLDSIRARLLEETQRKLKKQRIFKSNLQVNEHATSEELLKVKTTNLAEEAKFLNA